MRFHLRYCAIQRSLILTKMVWDSRIRGNECRLSVYIRNKARLVPLLVLPGNNYYVVFSAICVCHSSFHLLPCYAWYWCGVAHKSWTTMEDDHNHDDGDGYLAWCNQGSGGGVALANQLMTEHWTMRALSTVSTEQYEHWALWALGTVSAKQYEHCACNC